MSHDVADVLDRAADLLERDGWIQGQSKDPAGRRCAGQAIFENAHIPGYWLVVGAVRPYLDAAVLQWNDTPGRTAAEVIGKLREVAELERAQ